MFLKLDRRKPTEIGAHTAEDGEVRKVTKVSCMQIVDCKEVNIENHQHDAGLEQVHIYAINDDSSPARRFIIDFDEKGKASHDVYLMNNDGQTIERIF